MAGSDVKEPLLSPLARYKREKSIQINSKFDLNVDDQRGLRGIIRRVRASLRQVSETLTNRFSFATFPAKAGLASAICSIMCFIPGPLSVFNKNGMWAVVTADVVIETNVGLTFSKGVNRTLGTITAALLAIVVNYFAPKMGAFEPYYVVFFVFLGAALATMFKFRRPFKDRWNLAVAMAMIAFHILILSSADYTQKLVLPLIRIMLIITGFLVASLVTMGVAPKYAGNSVNELLGKNFERAGNVMERCVTAYREGTKLEQVPDILSGKKLDDNIHMSFHEIVSADSEVAKLLKAVAFEPCHGKFFFGYPWDMYDDITDNLRYSLYDVIALDSCLRAESQAPISLRRIFEEEFWSIGKECGQVFRFLGESIRTMRRISCQRPMERAEEGALVLQHKIAKYAQSLVGHHDDAHESDFLDYEQDGDEYEENEDAPNSYEDAFDITFSTSQPDTPPPHMEHLDSTKSAENGKSNSSRFQREGSTKVHRKTTVERISALSLIKFASLLIELVAKARYVVTLVEELEIKAHFAEGVPDVPEVNSTVTTPKAGDQQV